MWIIQAPGRQMLYHHLRMAYMISKFALSTVIPWNMDKEHKKTYGKEFVDHTWKVYAYFLFVWSLSQNFITKL